MKINGSNESDESESDEDEEEDENGTIERASKSDDDLIVMEPEQPDKESSKYGMNETTNAVTIN